MKTKNIFKCVGFCLLGTGFVILVVVVTMHLWNCLIPQLFNGPVLTFWQTAGLLILSKIFLTGLHHCGRHKHKRHHEGQCECNGTDEKCTCGCSCGCGGHSWWKHFKNKKLSGECCKNDSCKDENQKTE